MVHPGSPGSASGPARAGAQAGRDEPDWRTNSIDASRLGASFLEAHASGRFSPGRADERSRPPPRPPERRLPRSTQPRDVVAAPGAPQVKHPFLRKRSKQTNAPGRAPPGQGLQVATMALDIGYALEENLALRAADWVHGHKQRSLSPARSRSPRGQSSRARSPRSPRTRSPLAAPYPRLVEAQRHRQDALQRHSNMDAAVKPALPTGVTLNAQTGDIHGAPSAPQEPHQESARPAGLARVNGTDDEHGLANRMRPASREHPTGRVHVSGSRGPEGTPRGLRPFQEPDQQQAAQELASEELRYRAGQLELVLDSPLQAPPSPYESTYAEQYGLQRHHLIWSKSSDGGEGKTLTTPSNVPTEIPSSNAEEVDSVPEEINDRLVPTEIPSSNAEEADSVPEEINDRLVPTEIPSSNAEEVDSVLEEVSDRLILHDLRQSSTQISEAQEQQAKKGSAVRKVGVLDAAEVTPTEAANEVHRRRSFNPRPPLMSRSSTLLRQEPNETSDADIKPRKGRALRSGPDFPDRNAPTMQGSLQTRVEIHGTPVVFKAGRNWHTMDQMHRHGGSFLLGSHGHVHSESREHASGRVIIAGHHPQGALHSRPRTGMSTHRSSSGIGQRRPQTSSKRQEPEALSADEIVNAAFISAFPVHKPPAKSIFPASRLELPAKLEEPLLQDSKIRDLKMQKVKTGVQPCPRLLNLENLVVNWTDWTVPPELSARRDPSRDRPESSRPANKTPLLQSEMRRSHTSHQAPSEGIGDNRPLTDRPSHTRRTVQRGRGNLSGKQDSPHFSTDRMRPQTTEGGVRKLLPSETNRAQGSGTFHHGELRPQTVGTHQKRRDASKSSKGDNPRPMTSEGAQHVGLGRTSPATEQAESDDGMSISDASSPTRASTRASKRGGSALWSNIVSHDDAGSFFYERALHLDQPDSPNKDSSSTDHGSMMKEDRLAGQLDMDSSESGSRAVGQGVARVEPSISLHSGHVPLEWIGTKSYKDYIQDVESVVAKNSEADLSLVQDERVRQLVPGKIKSGLYSMPSKRSSLLTCGLIRTPSGYLSRTSSVNGQKSKTSLTVDGIKAMPTNESQGRSQSPKLSAKEAMEAARLAKAQVFIDLKNDLDAKIEDSKWGTREALGSEGGFADLIQCQEYTHQFENKYDVIKEGCNNFFGTHLKEEKQQHLLEGRAHTEATMEESKCYISAFYTNKLERFSDSNALATKDWSGMTRQEIMKHAEFLRELEYVKFKSNDLVARLTRQGREIVKRSNMKTISRIPSGASRVSDSGKKPSSNLTSQPHTKQHFGRTPSAVSKRGFFRVFVLEAVDLPNLSDKKEFADTYVRCELRTEGNEYKRGEKGFVENTDIAWQSLSPSWKKEFEFDVPELREDISISLSVLDVDIQYGQQTSTDTLIGSVEIPIFKEGYQMMSAEQETTKWLTLYKDNREVVSNQRQSLGRNALIKLSMVFTRKDRMTFGTSAHRIQTAYRCHLARAEFGRRREEIEGLRNRDSQNAKIVEKLDREHMWDTYLKFCYEENAKPVSECKRQFAHRDSFKLDHYYVPFRAVCAICRMLVEVYPHGRLKNLELRYTGINSPGMVVLANAIRSGCTALNSLILTGNHFTQEANDVTQANHPITNRLGKGMSGCRAIADVINETTTLKRLSFASCRLGNEGLAEIAKALQVNRHVEFLDLSDTNEDPMTAMYSAATELGKMLAQNDDIIELQLHSVGFPGQSSLALLGGGKFTSTGLRLNASLRVLNISRNNLCRSLVANAALRDFLCSEYCFLEHLDLGYNHMDQHGVLVFADGLIGNNSLLHVILDGNELGVIGCRTLLSYRGRKTVMGTSNKGLSEQAKSRKPKSKVQVRMIFEKFDRDHSGAMDVREMGEFLDSLSNTDLGTAEKIIAAIDADNSGAIEFDEFYEWYMKTLGVEDDGDKPVEISLEHCGGYSNVKGFDPSDPNGVYRLVMSEPSSCSTLLCMMQMVFAGKAEFLLGTMKRIEEDEDDEHARNYNLDISDDPTSWTVPQDGVLLFEFGVVRPSAGLNDCVGSFIMNHLRDSYGKPTGTPEEREEALIACSGEDSFFRYKQIVEILKLLDKGAEADPKRQLTVMEERVTLVSRLYLRMVDKENYSKLLGRLNDQERAEVEERLGIVAFKFDPNNATGYHRLDLKRPYEREVMVRLIEIRNSQRNAIFNWKKHLNRASGGREDFELVFRNLKYAGDPLQYTNSYRVPEVGVIELDFVDIRKPDPKMAKAMGDDDFQMLMASLGEASKKPTTKASEIREASNRNFFTCLQLWKLLCLFDKHKADESTCRVEIVVGCYARIVDWRAIRRVLLMEFLSSEMRALEYRLGKTLLYFDEICAPVGFWELDLSNQDDRWITQELVYLASVEPGYNVIQAKLDAVAPAGALNDEFYRFDGIDFQLPITWVSNVPSKGVLKLFYAREADINANYLNYGSWDRRGTPLLRPDPSCFPPIFKVPAIPKTYNEIKDGIEPIWVYVDKLRVIKSALFKISSSPDTMFQLLDTSGDGELSRKELALGLFRIGVWLTPVEAEMLLKVVDVDGSGEVDQDEFASFWLNAPPFRYGDEEQKSYWVPRRCTEDIYAEMLHFYDIRMCYPNADFSAPPASQ